MVGGDGVSGCVKRCAEGREEVGVSIRRSGVVSLQCVGGYMQEVSTFVHIYLVNFLVILRRPMRSKKKLW